MAPPSPHHPEIDADANCKTIIPSLLSSFIDAFVDFSVSGGLFLPQDPNPKSQHPNPKSPSPRTHFPAPSRLIAIGDLHGDLPKSLQTLTLASLIDPTMLSWAPQDPSTVAVQIGDVLDRGSDELKLLYLLHRLKLQSGGRLVTLLGNHEIMNLELDFRYVTPNALAEFENWAFWFRNGISMKKLCPLIEPPRNPFSGIPKSFAGVKKPFWDGFRARIAALRPNGPITSRFLVDNQTIVVIGDSVFVHGGLIEKHVEYGLERINGEVRDWIMGLKGRLSPAYMRGRDSVVWLRSFSDGYNCDCENLRKVLEMIPGVKRMVMGHTIQKEGINGVCKDKAIRIDVGISKGCGNGLPEVLEIVNGKDMRILTANPLYDERRYKSRRMSEETNEGLAILAREGRMKEVETKA